MDHLLVRLHPGKSDRLHRGPAYTQITEALNLYAHMHLASLRQPAGQPRLYPTGWGFGIAVCANYWYEILGLVGLIAITVGDIGSEFLDFERVVWLHDVSQVAPLPRFIESTYP